MDDLDAPQWADLCGPSPQVCSLDNYFLRRNNELKHEYRDRIDSESPYNLTSKKIDQSNEYSSENESIFQKTPVRIMTKCKKSASSKKSKVKETTSENILMEAMSNLKLSFKHMGNDKSFNKSCLIDSPAFKTPTNRVTRSMCAHAVNLPKDCVELKEDASTVCNKGDLKQESKENISLGKEGHEKSNSSASLMHEESSQINLEVTATSTEHEISHEKSDADGKIELEQVIVSNEKIEVDQTAKSKIVTKFVSVNNSKPKITTLTGNARQRLIKRRMSITNQRRLSILKPAISNKFVSMAEAITKFQRATPQRFHTATNVKTTRTEQLRRKSLKLTKAISPALTCKSRSRPVTALSAEERERLELEKIRKNQIKANPVRKDILQKPAPLKKVVKKMITNPEPFNLTETKKGQPPAKQNQEIKRSHQIYTKTVPSIVSTDDKGIVVKDEEVTGFGIPLGPCKLKKKNTKVMPFSFESRNKELQIKKVEKLKMIQQTQQNQINNQFHARPVPAAVKTPINRLRHNSDSGTISKFKVPLSRSLSFEERHKQLQKKKNDKIKQLLDEEKKARTFKAQKVPEFKPVIIRGRSKDNLKKSSENVSILQNKSKTNTTVKSINFAKKPISIPFVAPKKNSPISITKTNQENDNQGTVPKILQPKCKFSQKSVAVLSELNTDKRAKQRKQFDDLIKIKERREEELKKKLEDEKMEQEKAEKIELRKMTETKARPMPVYKPMQILKSNKLLTDAHSPAWAKRKGSIH